MKSAAAKKPNKYLFILPNILTLSSLFAGFYSIIVLTGEEVGNKFFTAALALIAATAFDMLDGRVARATKTQSEFGLHMDSLVDLVSFGIAPAFLIYKWSLHHFGFFGILSAFIFAGCGACRLARFNVLELKKKDKASGPSKYFVGLPIPLAAGMLISIVLVTETNLNLSPNPWGILGLTLLLAYLMVSNIKFRTFKDLKVKTPTTRMILLFLFGLLIFAGWQLGFAATVLFVFSTYILGNITEELGIFVSRTYQNVRAIVRGI